MPGGHHGRVQGREKAEVEGVPLCHLNDGGRLLHVHHPGGKKTVKEEKFGKKQNTQRVVPEKIRGTGSPLCVE